MKSLFLALLALLAVDLAAAQTYTESILYSFGAVPNDGSGPVGGLVMDSAGNLYGTTPTGGASNFGTVFKMSPKGVETILHQFSLSDGANPRAGLTFDKAGNLYGTTEWGGKNYGVVFKYSAKGVYSILHSFGVKSTDGQAPLGPVTLDASGNIYGTASQGGSTAGNCTQGTTGCGIIFKLSPTGVEHILYSFTGALDNGAAPSWNVSRDASGNLYATAYGGDSQGILLKLTPQNVGTVLYSGLVDSYFLDEQGTFYGTWQGSVSGGGFGTWQFADSTYTLDYFCEACVGGSPYGWDPSGPLHYYDDLLYGTTEQGGSYYTGQYDQMGGGVVYSFAPSSKLEQVLYSFPNPGTTTTDGWNPNSGVIMDSAGNLYGTTSSGGAYGAGTVFKLTKN